MELDAGRDIGERLEGGSVPSVSRGAMLRQHSKDTMERYDTL